MKSLEAGYSILALRQFHERHPAAAFACLGDSEYLLSLWANDDLRFHFSDTPESVAECLNNILIDPSFDAIYHVDTHQVEFFFRYVDPTDPWASPFLARRFTVNFQNHDFECWFEAPTERAMLLARSSHRLPSDPAEHIVSQIRLFKDAQRLPELSEHIQKYFFGKVPLNFFVSTEQFPQVDLRDLARHINVLTSYYDRQSPVIVIRTENTNAQGTIKPKRFFESQFPIRLTARDIDDVVLTLLEVASQSSPRAAFLYFYQIFEYAGHYYIDDKTRKSLKRLLRDPSLSSCDDRKVGELFSILGDLHQHDEQRMQRVVEEHCVPQNLWSEIQNDIDFFSKPVEFDGGLTLDRIVSPQANVDAWNEVFKTIFPIFTKMRNCIVHAREKRESKVILPTHSNSLKLARFLPIIRRMAEDVAFRS